MRMSALLASLCLPYALVGCVESSKPTEPAAGLEDSPHPTKPEPTDARLSRNMVNTVDKNIPAEWSTEEGAQKHLKWAVKIGTGQTGYMPPAIAGGKVFIAANNTEPSDPKVKGKKAILKCFRESDGQFLWQIVHDPAPPDVAFGPWTGSSEGEGLLSTPFVDSNRLYYVTPGAEVVCADTDGKVAWRYDMRKELKVFPCYCAACSPLVAGDLVFVVTGNGKDANNKLPAPEAPSFLALDKKTGKLQWQSNLPGNRIVGGQWDSPAYAVVNDKPQVIFPGGDGWLYSFEPQTGKLIWKFNCNPKTANGKKSGRDAPNYFLAAPVVHNNQVYIGVGHYPDGPGSDVGHFWCIDVTKTGDVSPVNDNFDPKAEVNKNSGLVWHYGGLIKPEPKRGPKEVFGPTFSTAAIHDGLVYVAELNGILHCLDAKTGQKQWAFDLLAQVWASPYYVDGNILLGGDNGDFIVVPHGRTPPVKDAIKKIDMGHSIRASAVAANGTLYVVTVTHLYAIAGK